MLRFITKPRISMLDSAFCLVSALAVSIIGAWLALGLLIVLLLVSSAIERSVWK